MGAGGSPAVCFNTQPPEGGWTGFFMGGRMSDVSTHSRPKAAGVTFLPVAIPETVSTHSRPKAAGLVMGNAKPLLESFNTQPPEGGWLQEMSVDLSAELFQHTAARRRLVENSHKNITYALVSTHSRPKAAGIPPARKPTFPKVSTHSRPKAAGAAGGQLGIPIEFQHTAARRRLGLHLGFG